MTRSPTFLAGLGALAFGVAGVGCSTDPRSDALAAPVAAMPMVHLPARAPQVKVTFEEIMRLAQTRNVAPMVAATQQIEDVVSRAQLVAEVTAALARNEPALATDFALALPAGRARDASLAQLLHAQAQRGADVLTWATQLPDPMASSVARQLAVEELVRANPRAAIERVLALPADASREDLLNVAVAAWARSDAAAAVNWVRSLPDDARKQRLTSTVAFEIAQANPGRAIELAESLPAGRDRWLLFSAIGQTWVARDPREAMAWANRLPAGDPREAAFAGIDTGLGIPSARRVAVAPGIGGGGGRGRGGASGPATWPELRDPEFAAWLATQQPGMSRDEAILEYVRQRGALQPTAVGLWLSSIPGGPARDQAVDIFVSELANSSPAEAARWLRTLPRSNRSEEMLEKTARRWLLTNPDAAEIWLRDAPLPPDRKEQLLREVGR